MSAFKFYPLDLAEVARETHPKLWAKHGTGGNPPTAWTGNHAYQTYRWMVALQDPGYTGTAKDYATAKEHYRLLTKGAWTGPANRQLLEEVVELWLEKRERYATRHQRDFRPGGITAAIKWAVVLPWALEQSGGDVQAAAELMLEEMGEPK